MVIIPEEAERLLPFLREMDLAPTHLLTYSAPVTRKMLIFNDLNYFSVPALPDSWKPPLWLKIELGIFAGRLYFHYPDYEVLCKYLGANEGPQVVENEEDFVVEPDDTPLDSSLTEPGQIGEMESEPKLFTKKPLVFMQEWLAIRRKGQDFTHTPMVSDEPIMSSKQWNQIANYLLGSTLSRKSSQGRSSLLYDA